VPAKSQAQRGYLASHFGAAWMRKHHFDNEGPLPEHVKKRGYKSKHHHDIATRALNKV
jgi:hypothetical protein